VKSPVTETLPPELVPYTWEEDDLDEGRHEGPVVEVGGTRYVVRERSRTIEPAVYEEQEADPKEILALFEDWLSDMAERGKLAGYALGEDG